MGKALTGLVCLLTSLSRGPHPGLNPRFWASIENFDTRSMALLCPVADKEKMSWFRF